MWWECKNLLSFFPCFVLYLSLLGMEIIVVRLEKQGGVDKPIRRMWLLSWQKWMLSKATSRVENSTDWGVCGRRQPPRSTAFCRLYFTNIAKCFVRSSESWVPGTACRLMQYCTFHVLWYDAPYTPYPPHHCNPHFFWLLPILY